MAASTNGTLRERERARAARAGGLSITCAACALHQAPPDGWWRRCGRCPFGCALSAACGDHRPPCCSSRWTAPAVQCSTQAAATSAPTGLCDHVAHAARDPSVEASSLSLRMRQLRAAGAPCRESCPNCSNYTWSKASQMRSRSAAVGLCSVAALTASTVADVARTAHELGADVTVWRDPDEAGRKGARDAVRAVHCDVVTLAGDDPAALWQRGGLAAITEALETRWRTRT